MPFGGGSGGGGGAGVISKVYFNKPAANITRAFGTGLGSLSTAWQITNVVVGTNQNVRLTAQISTSQTTINDRLFAFFRGASQLNAVLQNPGVANQEQTVTMVWVDANPGAGTYTYEVEAATFTAGTLTVFQTTVSTDVIGGTSVFVAEVYTP